MLRSKPKQKYKHIPLHPRDYEKYLYVSHHQRILTIFSVFAVTGVLISSYQFFKVDPILYVFYPFWILGLVTFVVSTVVQGFGSSFDPQQHDNPVRSWHPRIYPTVDIFLPVCGEDIEIIKNTWEGVQGIQRIYKGGLRVYCLDDGDSAKTKRLAEDKGFTYLVRDDRGHFKKAGNLRHGFRNSKGDFIVIFDADFRPRADFLYELLPHFFKDPKLGIVQSPQYFDVHKNQNWLERGAGAVQEYFYRSIQQNRQSHDGAICVGSNAIYRRAALASNGGTTLIEHSEDVHTGFDLRLKGWDLKYIPVVLAKGICPDDLGAFFRQQYRWCKGSMSLLGSDKFWSAKLSFRSRLCYLSGFLYYIQTAVIAIVAPLIPLALLFMVPQLARLHNYLLLIPAIIYNLVVFPLWHRSGYRFESFSVRVIYGWAHLFAIIDSLFKRNMAWLPTGSVASGSTQQYRLFTFLIIFYSFGMGLVWFGSGIWHMVYWNPWNFLPVTTFGMIYLLTVSRVVLAVVNSYD